MNDSHTMQGDTLSTVTVELIRRTAQRGMNDGKVPHFLATAGHCRPEAPQPEARRKGSREASGPITQAVSKARAE